MLNKLVKLIKLRYKYFHNCYYTKSHLKPPWNVLFFGTDDFSVASLKALHNVYKKGNLINRLEVVTSTKSKQNPVQNFATREKLIIHSWPIPALERDRFHIGIVVSFGHLIPENIINAVPLGILNVHASLLPRWRGAAPIIHAIANGDKVTGITIMRIRPNKFDIGEIVTQTPVVIPDYMKMTDLYVTLADRGAETLTRVLNEVPGCLFNAKPQSNVGITVAPRVNSKMSCVDWHTMTAQDVYNLHRALTGIFELTTSFNNVAVKLCTIVLCNNEIMCEKSPSNEIVPGFIKYSKEQKCLHIQCKDGNWISVGKIGIRGKKMTASDFNNGFLKKEKANFRIFRYLNKVD